MRLEVNLLGESMSLGYDYILDVSVKMKLMNEVDE